MAGGDEFVNRAGARGWGGPMAATLFIGAGTNVYDAYSAVMSSPWSTEKFTKDSGEDQMARRYVKHAICISWAYAIGGALIVMADPETSNSLAAIPIVGAALATGYMYWLYNQALKRALSGEGMSAAEPPQNGTGGGSGVRLGGYGAAPGGAP